MYISYYAPLKAQGCLHLILKRYFTLASYFKRAANDEAAGGQTQNTGDEGAGLF